MYKKNNSIYKVQYYLWLRASTGCHRTIISPSEKGVQLYFIMAALENQYSDNDSGGGSGGGVLSLQTSCKITLNLKVKRKYLKKQAKHYTYTHTHKKNSTGTNLKRLPQAKSRKI